VLELVHQVGFQHYRNTVEEVLEQNVEDCLVWVEEAWSLEHWKK